MQFVRKPRALKVLKVSMPAALVELQPPRYALAYAVCLVE